MHTETIKDNLRKLGLKASQARTKIYSQLSKQSCAVTAESLHRLVGTKEFDFSTVYRNLKTFVDKGIVQALYTGDGAARYELLNQPGHHHHHLICRRCQKIVVIHKCFIPKKLSQRSFKGFKDVSHRLEFEGLCPACS